jgi:alkaline phosphatase
MRRFRSTIVLALAVLVASCADAASPTRVILFIGDGAGTSYWTAASLAADNLAVNQLPVVGLVDTEASDSRITDSAAAATAYASGTRTYNGAIGVDPDTNAVVTVLEVARRRGMATGLVATSSLTHATPAAFASHVPTRGMQWEIARQMAEAGIDVLLGGGRRYFEAAGRPDGLDLLAAMAAEDAVVLTRDGFQGLDTDSVSKLVGLFASEHMPGAFSRVPSLPEMTARAIEVLDKDPDGFFLMVEGSQPDWRGHDNASLDTLTAEMLDLDAAIGVALEYQRGHPSTLVVVTADHETGGLAVQMARPGQSHYAAAATADRTADRIRQASLTTDRETMALADSTRALLARLAQQLRLQTRDTARAPELVARYATGTHTASMVPLFASGPGAERFGGIKDNWMIGRLLLEAVRQ